MLQQEQRITLMKVKEGMPNKFVYVYTKNRLVTCSFEDVHPDQQWETAVGYVIKDEVNSQDYTFFNYMGRDGDSLHEYAVKELEKSGCSIFEELEGPYLNCIFSPQQWRKIKSLKERKERGEITP
jgi:hypothetical protein